MNSGIYLFPADSGACGHYRVVRPGAALGKISGRKPLKSAMLPAVGEWEKLNPKVIITQRQTNEEQAKYWQEFRKEHPDLRMVMDFDDLLWMPHPLSTYRTNRSMIRSLDAATQCSSHIVASTEPMRDALVRRYRRDVTVVPNMIRREELSPVRPRKPGDKLRVVWAGSDTHKPDLEQLVPAVLQTLEAVEWVFFGYIPPELKGRVQHAPAVPLGSYLATLRSLNAHVGVAPLVSNAFNECKSNLKILEYGACGMATVASPVAPYIESKGFLTKSFRPREWVRAIEQLRDEEVRYSVAMSSQEYTTQFLVENHSELLLDTYLRSSQ